MTGYVFYEPPKYVGAYRIGGPNGLAISLSKKPNWFHRYMMRLCLGWEWVDEKTKGENKHLTTII